MVEGMLAEAFDLIAYEPKPRSKKDKEWMNKAQFYLPDWEGWIIRRNGNFFQAEYRGVNFTCSDVWFYRYESTNVESTNYEIINIFKGQRLTLGLRKEIHSPVVVTQLMGGICMPLPSVQTGNPAFDEAFSVFAGDERVAFDVLTPRFMEILLSMRVRQREGQMASGRKHLCFTGRHLYVAMNTGRDLVRFDDTLGGMMGESDILALRERTQSQIDFIKEELDGFLLDESLFQVEEISHHIEEGCAYEL